MVRFFWRVLRAVGAILHAAKSASGEPMMTELELFEAALERSPADRAACLDEACAGNQPLRQRLDALLARHERAASFLEAPAPEILPSHLGRGAGGEGA